MALKAPILDRNAFTKTMFSIGQILRSSLSTNAGNGKELSKFMFVLVDPA